MYLSRVVVTNVKGFSGPRSVDLDLTRPDGSHAGWTVIAGRNGSGKTTLLRAIALAMRGPRAASGLVADFSSWVSSGTDHASVAITLVPAPAWDRFQLQEVGDAPGEPFEASLSWAFPENQNAHNSRFRQPVMFIAGEDLRSATARTGPWSENVAGWFCAAYGPFRRLIGGLGDSHQVALRSTPAASLASLFHENASLAEGVTWLIDQHLRSLEGKPGAKQVKETALRILSDGLLPDGYSVDGVDSDGLWITSGDQTFPLREMSDGYRTVAALVVDLLKQIDEAFGMIPISADGNHPAVDVPGVVIIDEVDAHLHVSWQKRIGGWLKAHFPKIQFIVTTHSPYVCQAADPGGIIRLAGPNEQEAPAVVGEDLYERIVFGSGDDAVLSDLFGLDTPYSDRARALRRELVDLEVLVVADTATDSQVARYEELRDLLTSSPVARVGELAARIEDRPVEE